MVAGSLNARFATISLFENCTEYVGNITKIHISMIASWYLGKYIKNISEKFKWQVWNERFVDIISLFSSMKARCIVLICIKSILFCSRICLKHSLALTDCCSHNLSQSLIRYQCFTLRCKSSWNNALLVFVLFGNNFNVPYCILVRNILISNLKINTSNCHWKQNIVLNKRFSQLLVLS